MVPEARIIKGELGTGEMSGSFEVILLNQVIEHVEDDVGLLKEIADRLVKNGMLILGTPNEGSRLQQLWLRRQGDSFETDHVHFYTEKEIRFKIQTARFNIDSVMREVFFVGNYNWYYALTRRRWGFKFLELLSKLWPAECSDYYFECHKA